jgi:hypothetical protein
MRKKGKGRGDASREEKKKGFLPRSVKRGDEEERQG